MTVTITLALKAGDRVKVHRDIVRTVESVRLHSDRNAFGEPLYVVSYAPSESGEWSPSNLAHGQCGWQLA